MLSAWGRLVFRKRWWVLSASVLLLAASLALLQRGGQLTSGALEGTESEVGGRLLERALGTPGESSFSLLFESARHTADQPEFTTALRSALQELRADPRVAYVTAPDEAPPAVARSLTAADNRAVLAHVALADDFQEARRHFPDLLAKVRSDALQVTVTGHLAFMRDLDETLERDLRRAEAVSLPLALAVLLLVFRTLVAAALPVGVGALAVAGGVGVVLALSHVLPMAAYTINVVSLIGLAVAIDYSLFIVSRYREELGHGATREDALAIAMTTSGRAVMFSGLAVGIGLGGLLFFRGSWLPGVGLAGGIVVFIAVFYAFTFLPALLAVLGPRIDWGRVPLPRLGHGDRAWALLARRVMRRPVVVLLPTLFVLLAVGQPFLHLHMASADVRSLPSSSEARRGFEEIQRRFPEQAATRVVAVVEFPDEDVLTAERIAALYRLSRQIAALPGVAAVQSVVDLDPALAVGDYERLLTLPEMLMPPDVVTAIRSSVGGGVAVLAALVPDAPESEVTTQVVRRLRAQGMEGEGRLWVTGQTAHDLDVQDFLLAHTPKVVAFVVVTMLVVLFLLLGSVLLPFAAVVMNVLSIIGAFGALVWVFQQGNLSGILGFVPAPIEPTLPILLFCVVFGLSMDYEVLLLSRIQEEYLRTGDTAKAIALGLQASGKLITSAAAIMIAVFAAFSLADIVLIKAMGFALAVAVALDSSLVRMLIVPSSMRLMDRWNWWAPAWLRRLQERVGLHAALLDSGRPLPAMAGSTGAPGADGGRS